MNLSRVWEDFQALFAGALERVADGLLFLGDHRWAAAIFVVTLVVNTLLLPLAIKQFRSTQAMQRLQPEVKRLQQKYRKDRQKLNQEIMELYRREGVNPLGGCLPIFAQIPVFFAMFAAIRGIESRVDEMPFLGLGNLADLARESVGGWLLLAVMTITQLLSTRQVSTAQNRQQQLMFQLMPFAFLLFLINYPAGLVLYWAVQGLYRFVQQAIMIKATKLPEPPAPKGKALKKAKGKPVPARARKRKNR